MLEALIKKPKIVLVSPHHSEMIHTKAALSILGQSIYCDKIITPESRSESLATLRNQLVLEAFKQAPDFTHLLWLDGDEIFPASMTPQLLEHDKDIIGAWTVIRQDRKPNVYKILYKNKRGGYKHKAWTLKEIKQLKEPLQLVDRLGFGSMLIKRKVFEEIPQPWFAFDDSHDTEDLFFNDRSRDYGFDTYCDFSLRCLHISLAFL